MQKRKWSVQARFFGYPKDEYKVAELARSYTVEAVETLVDLVDLVEA